MIEAAWLALLLIACRNPEVRPTVMIVSIMAVAQYALLILHPGPAAEVACIVLDIWAATACALAMPGRKPAWSIFVLSLFAVSLTIQGAYWLVFQLGHYYGRELHLFAQSVFSAQVLLLTFPEGRVRASRSRINRRDRRALLVRSGLGGARAAHGRGGRRLSSGA